MSNYYGVPRRTLVGEAWFWIAMAIVAAAVIAIGTFGWRWVTASPKGKLQAREQINSGSFRIQAYDHFFDLCASVQTVEGTLTATYDQLADADESDKARIQANIVGLKAARLDSINQYNADASKNYTSGQFLASNLPYTLPIPYVRGETTSCSA